MQLDNDTIAAIASAPGRGGIGVIRVSGKHSLRIAEKIIGASSFPKKITPRNVVYSALYGADLSVIDRGIILYFSAPHSFTGEDVIEFQCHGGPVVLDRLLAEILRLGARMARAGEFSERAFLNNKLDLVQTEAIADLINAETVAAARSAILSLEGLFSKEINLFIEELIALRAYIEAAIDFPEEDVDFLADSAISGRLESLKKSLNNVMAAAQQGALLVEGAMVVIAGEPNAGKSSLLNTLAGHDAAIVTPIAGTTRDVLREHIQLEGMFIHLIDTAGLGKSNDLIELEGMRRAQLEITKADLVLLVVDSCLVDKEILPLSSAKDFWPFNCPPPPDDIPIILVLNKCDLSGISLCADMGLTVMTSTKTGAGITELKKYIVMALGYKGENSSVFSARRRHLEALKQALGHVERGIQQLSSHRAGELLAEDLRLAQQSLGEITGRFAPDDLLEKIFSDFCIGK